ncbi:hypothetical protein DPMN_088533 [Dreissena polymorpha]|uniref:Uncharacterized protein n=1 Tax=Dreissena polymorpha TaxID=45954 RepID=A0A9D4KV13_DREPO|nr:hypothetical protein DPMN_088533 [Dreissena polymorpha]
MNPVSRDKLPVHLDEPSQQRHHCTSCQYTLVNPVSRDKLPVHLDEPSQQRHHCTSCQYTLMNPVSRDITAQAASTPW